MPHNDISNWLIIRYAFYVMGFSSLMIHITSGINGTTDQRFTAIAIIIAGMFFFVHIWLLMNPLWPVMRWFIEATGGHIEETSN